LHFYYRNNKDQVRAYVKFKRYNGIFRNNRVVIEIKKSEKPSLLQKEQLLTRIFLTRKDERTVNNYKEIMDGFIKGVSKKQSSKYNIKNAVHKSSSVAYPIVDELLKKGFLKQIGTMPPKRGRRINEVPVYELTPYGQVLLGYLKDKTDTIMDGIKSFQDYPFYTPFCTLVLTAQEAAPQGVVFESAYIWLESLGSFNSSVESLLQIILTEMDKTVNQELKAQITELLSQKFETLYEEEQMFVCEYFGQMTRLKYLQKLHGKELSEYVDIANKWGPEYIVYKCEKCGKIIEKTNPFEIKPLCDKCANLTTQNPTEETNQTPERAPENAHAQLPWKHPIGFP
jgi:rubrerythrin